MSSVRVLTSGIDTLHLFTTAPLRNSRVDELESAKQVAITLPRSDPLPSIDIAGHTLIVQRTGARTAPFRLDSDHMAVLASPWAPTNLPQVTVELRSVFLWQAGVEHAASEAQRVSDALTSWNDQAELKVSRVDLTVDFQGWLPALRDLDRLVTRASRRDAHIDGPHFTGFSFGKGDFVARLYDKTREIQKSDKQWFFDVWRASPDYRHGEPVWRLEYQLRRQALRKLWLPSRRGGTSKLDRIESWLDIRDLGRGLWRFLASRWLTMREPRKRDTRQVLTSEWRALVDQGFASGLWEGTDADLYRAEREAGAKRTDAAFAGYLARGLAEMQFFSGIDVPLESAVPTLVQRAQRIMERKGTTLEERAGERAEGWRRQRASMAARAQEDETNPQGNENETPRTCCPTCAGGRP